MRRFIPILALLAGAVPAGRLLRAQGTSAAPLLLEPFDFSPTGGWRRRAADVRNERMQLLRQGDLQSLNAVRGSQVPGRFPFVIGVLPTTAVTGAFHVPVIVIQYQDVSVQYPIASFQCLLFSRAPGACGNSGDRPYSVTTFYEEMSQHRITMDGTVLPAVRMDSAAAFYTDGCKGFTVFGQTSCPSRPQNRMAQMLVAALDSISLRPGGDTIWSQFDNDGPDGIPNSGDDDGVVDFVGFLQPEVGGECIRNPTPPTGIWSHRYVISGWSITSPNTPAPDRMYVTRTRDVGNPSKNRPPGFIKVNDYTIQSQLGGSTACDGTSIMGIGTIAHETGHAFGLPDLYDVSGATQGIGGWGLMGSGNYARPYSPSSYDAWSLHALGWTTVDTLGTSRTVTAGPRLLTDTIFYARTANPDEYLLLENRQAVRSDTAQMNPVLPSGCPPPPGSSIANLGFCAKSPGLLLWLIDDPKLRTGLLGNSVNVGSVQGVELIQADGLNQLRTQGSFNRGDRGDPYPGSTNNPRFSLLAAPGARDNVGNFIGFIIDRITQLPSGAMSFRFTRRAPSLIQALGGAQIRINGDSWGRYEEVIPGGDPVQLGADSTQTLAGGKTRARFVAWSRGGPREQTIVSNPAKPDTISASFTIEHRILLTTSGGGTVTASAAGDLAQGVFLAEGSTVTLTANPPAGLIFAGWRGDTVATGPSLQLTLRKGYDLEARFVTLVNVAAQDAVSELLGTPKLSDAQRSFLDELGNRNGVFDVGDLLAYYRRLGQAAPPAVLQAALRAAPAKKSERRP